MMLLRSIRQQTCVACSPPPPTHFPEDRVRKARSKHVFSSFFFHSPQRSTIRTQARRLKQYLHRTTIIIIIPRSGIYTRLGKRAHNAYGGRDKLGRPWRSFDLNRISRRRTTRCDKTCFRVSSFRLLMVCRVKTGNQSQKYTFVFRSLPSPLSMSERMISFRTS